MYVLCTFVTLRESGVHPLLMASIHLLWRPHTSFLELYPCIYTSTRSFTCLKKPTYIPTQYPGASLQPVWLSAAECRKSKVFNEKFQ